LVKTCLVLKMIPEMIMKSLSGVKMIALIYRWRYKSAMTNNPWNLHHRKLAVINMKVSLMNLAKPNKSIEMI